MSSKGKYPIGYNSQTIQRFQRRSAFEKARFLLPYLKTSYTLLDCGCGPGSITLDFASILSQGKVVGIDIELSQIEKSNKLAEKRKVTNAIFQVANVLDLPFETNTFDVAFTHAVLWTVCDIHLALRELKRVVKPGGIIAIREPNADGLLYYPQSELLDKAFELQFRSQREFGCDNNIGKKMTSYFAQAELSNIQTTTSSDTYSSKEKREELIRATTQAWKEAPWAKKVREKKWASETKIKEFFQALSLWEKEPDAYLSVAWSEVIGYVP